MKKTNIIKWLGAVLIGGTLASCSGDYLDLEPESEFTNNTVFESEDAIKLAAYGMCGNMYRQYSSLYDFRWFNGEPWVSMFYGEAPGSDYICYFWVRSQNVVVNWDIMSQHDSNAAFMGWTYCYGIIASANNIIAGTEAEDPTTLSESVRFYRAHALAMRAHAYTRLLQIYGPRWQDSQNGAKKTIPLRLVPADTNTDAVCPLSTMGEVLASIYKDLDEAISIYDSVKMSRSYYWEPDGSVARGLYARAALLKEDWATAEKMAHDARAGYPIMSSEEYMDGFAAPNAEWMWACDDNFSGIYYASFGATYACNGAYPTLWGNIGAGAIDISLYNKMDRNDVRRQLFFTPATAGVYAGKKDFYNKKNISTTSMDINRGGLAKSFDEFCNKRYNAVGASKGWYPPYANPTNGQRTGILAQFGAQFKFWGIDEYSSSSFPYMRGAEMLFIEAEAACHNGNEAVAIANLKEVNEKRYTKNYKPSTSSGEALLEEVRLNKRLELWGEGYSWFDMKRWNVDMVREPWREDDTESGNWPELMTIGNYDADSHYGWRWAIPRAEYQYNTAIDPSELDF